jgi:hypothetical protein
MMFHYRHGSGDGLLNNKPLSFGIYRPRVAQGETDGCERMARSKAARRDCVVIDPAACDINLIKALKVLAEEGSAGAQHNLGVTYYKGQGVPRDYLEALKWFRKAAEQNYPEAQFNIGVMYEYGQGVATDDAEAGNWYYKAASQGLTDAQYRLGLMCEDESGADPAEIEVEAARDLAEVAAAATDWYRLAAEQGHADAQFRLGQHYRYSGPGAGGNSATEKDYAEAARWYREAAIRGHHSARFSLGTMLMNGEGIQQDLLQAYVWFDLAASCEANPEHRTFVVDLRNAVRQRMTADQIAEAQRLVREWKAK